MSLYTRLKNWWLNSPKPNSKYGWRRDLFDGRDKIMFPQYADSGSVVVEVMPETVDLRGQMPAVYDQQSLGSCTANGIGGLLQYMSMKEKLADTRDRKSTRLNSSHHSISYAVFCLKKKK